eukprot:2835653-Pleurochrysis_carterae.AAC.1
MEAGAVRGAYACGCFVFTCAHRRRRVTFDSHSNAQVPDDKIDVRQNLEQVRPCMLSVLRARGA